MAAVDPHFLKKAYSLRPCTLCFKRGIVRRDCHPDLFIGERLEDYQGSYVAFFVLGLLVFADPLLIYAPMLRT